MSDTTDLRGYTWPPISDAIDAPDSGVVASSLAVSKVNTKADEAVAQAIANIVPLSSSLESTSETTAATPLAVKTLKDLLDALAQSSAGASVIAGTVLAFTGELGGSDGKRPINPYTGQADEGWALCDGRTYQAKSDTPMLPTPDLQGRFVMAADVTRPPGAIGGGESHTHGITVHGHTLTVEQMPSHTHSIQSRFTGQESTYVSLSGRGEPYQTTSDATGGSQPHAHGASSSAGSNLPPYYALAYIMKL